MNATDVGLRQGHQGYPLPERAEPYVPRRPGLSARSSPARVGKVFVHDQVTDTSALDKLRRQAEDGVVTLRVARILPSKPPRHIARWKPAVYAAASFSTSASDRSPRLEASAAGREMSARANGHRAPSKWCCGSRPVRAASWSAGSAESVRTGSA